MNKGPNSLGGRNSNNISTRYRGIHPSYLGHIDLLVCGNADPGTSGTLSPYGSIKGLYFDESHEPDDYMYSFKNDVANIMKNENVQYIEIHADNKEDYYRIIDELTEFTDNSITISGTSKDPLNVIIEKPVELDADNTANKEDSESVVEETSIEAESE